MTSASSRPRPPAVLLVGDRVAELLARVTPSSTHESHPAADATHARLVLQRLAADVVVVDLRVPVPTVLELAGDPRTSLEQIAAVLERDLVAVTEVIRLVNSTWFGMCTRVDSVVQAVRLLGVDVVQVLAVASAVFGTSAPAPRGVDLAEVAERRWRTPAAAALLAARWAAAGAQRRGRPLDPWLEGGRLGRWLPDVAAAQPDPSGHGVTGQAGDVPVPIAR